MTDRPEKTTLRCASARTRQQQAGDTKSRWTEERLTEPWVLWSARRKAERQGAGR